MGDGRIFFSRLPLAAGLSLRSNQFSSSRPGIGLHLGCACLFSTPHHPSKSNSESWVAVLVGIKPYKAIRQRNLPRASLQTASLPTLARRRTRYPNLQLDSRDGTRQDNHILPYRFRPTVNRLALEGWSLPDSSIALMVCLGGPDCQGNKGSFPLINTQWVFPRG